MNSMLLALTLVLIIAAIAAYTDIKSRRIPNVLPASLLAAGIALNALHGWQSAAISIGLFLGVFALGTFLFSFGVIGGGDVKLIAAAAALGWPDTVAFLLYTMVAGGVLGLVMSAVRGRLRPMFANVKSIVFPMLSGVRPAPISSSAVGTMPYGLAIFAGAATLALGNAFGLTLRIFA
jgi:prepilin peptidase CpaA